jgi:myosin heavy subunit
MASISVAVAAASAALGAGSIAQCSHVARQSKQVEVDVHAVARSLGVLRCRVSGGFVKAERHVTLLGDVLVVSRRPGSADTIISLQGADVEVADAGTAVKVVSHGSATHATFWPGSADETSQWAAELKKSNLPAQAVPKFLSITRQQRELIQAEVADWEDQIKRVQSNPSQGQAELIALEGEAAERESKTSQLQQELEKCKGMPKLVSLNRRQIAELESSIQQRESRVAELQSQLGGVQEATKMLSISRREVSSLEASVRTKESTVAELQDELRKLQDVPRMLSLSRRAASSLEAEAAQRDGQISEMQASLEDVLASGVPKMLGDKRRAVSQRERQLSEKDAKIWALEGRLQGFRGLPDILSFNQKQVEELEQRCRDTDKQLDDLRVQLQAAPTAVGA